MPFAPKDLALHLAARYLQDIVSGDGDLRNEGGLARDTHQYLRHRGFATISECPSSELPSRSPLDVVVTRPEPLVLEPKNPRVTGSVREWHKEIVHAILRVEAVTSRRVGTGAAAISELLVSDTRRFVIFSGSRHDLQTEVFGFTFRRVAREPSWWSPQATSTFAQAWPAVSSELPRASGGEQDVAVVVGVSDYLVLPDVAGAAGNATDWYGYLTRVRGVPSERIVLLRDREGTREKIERAVTSMGALVVPSSTAWLVYVGHGAPAPSGDDGLLLGVDTMPDSESPAVRGLPQARALAPFAEKAPAPIIAVFDACFSGTTADGSGALVEGQQATVPVRRTPAMTTTTVLSASPTFAGTMPGLARPAFSYALLGALRGWADANGNHFVTTNEAFT